MNKIIYLFMVLFSQGVFAQNCPINFPYTSSFCFTNNSGKDDFGNTFSAGCDFEVCVKVKPKASCYPECNYVSTDGFYNTICKTVESLDSVCIIMPSSTDPITDCWDVDITIQIIGNTPKLSKELLDIDFFDGESYYDDCLGLATDQTFIKRLVLGNGTYNFLIYMRRLAEK